MEWPAWWEWELEITPHLEKRMEDRDFTEIELREMLEQAQDTALMWLQGGGLLPHVIVGVGGK